MGHRQISTLCWAIAILFFAAALAFALR